MMPNGSFKIVVSNIGKHVSSSSSGTTRVGWNSRMLMLNKLTTSNREASELWLRSSARTFLSKKKHFPTTIPRAQKKRGTPATTPAPSMTDLNERDCDLDLSASILSINSVRRGATRRAVEDSNALSSGTTFTANALLSYRLPHDVFSRLMAQAFTPMTPYVRPSNSLAAARGLSFDRLRTTSGWRGDAATSPA